MTTIQANSLYLAKEMAMHNETSEMFPNESGRLQLLLEEYLEVR
jgi:hypothetical protein